MNEYLIETDTCISIFSLNEYKNELDSNNNQILASLHVPTEHPFTVMYEVQDILCHWFPNPTFFREIICTLKYSIWTIIVSYFSLYF